MKLLSKIWNTWRLPVHLWKEPLWIKLPVYILAIPTPFKRNGQPIVLFNAIAVTVWPFVFYTEAAVGEDGEVDAGVKRHELVHWKAQRDMGTVVGWLAWFVVYLLLLLILPPIYLVFAHRQMRIDEHPLEVDGYKAQWEE